MSSIMPNDSPGWIAFSKEAVNHPKHYTAGAIEVIDYIEQVVECYPSAVVATHIAQVIKYVSRAPHKENLLQDLKKAQWYLDRAVKHLEK